MYKSHDEDTFIKTSECIVMPTIFQALNKRQQLNQNRDKFHSHFSSFLTV